MSTSMTINLIQEIAVFRVFFFFFFKLSGGPWRMNNPIVNEHRASQKKAKQYKHMFSILLGSPQDLNPLWSKSHLHASQLTYTHQNSREHPCQTMLAIPKAAVSDEPNNPPNRLSHTNLTSPGHAVNNILSEQIGRAHV